MLLVEAYLLDNYATTTHFGQDCDNALFEDLRRIEINTRQNYRSQLHSLLHEAGHVVLRMTFPGKYKENFSALNSGAYDTKRANIAHRIDVLREEVLAWEQAEHLAGELNIPLDKHWFDRHRREALLTYVKWI